MLSCIRTSNTRAASSRQSRLDQLAALRELSQVRVELALDRPIEDGGELEAAEARAEAQRRDAPPADPVVRIERLGDDDDLCDAMLEARSVPRG